MVKNHALGVNPRKYQGRGRFRPRPFHVRPQSRRVLELPVEDVVGRVPAAVVGKDVGVCRAKA
jgi:hypothetical protein